MEVVAERSQGLQVCPRVSVIEVEESGAEKFSAVGGRGRELLELGVGYALILLVLWTPNPWQRLLYWVAVLWVLAASCISFRGWRRSGFGASGFLRSLWVVVVAVLIAGAAFLLAAKLHTLHPPHGPVLFFKRFWGYGIWAFAQQFILQDFVLLRLLRLLPGRTAAITAAAGLFALAHLPNPLLTLVTLTLGLAACWVFLKYNNLYTLAMAHAVLGICIAVAVPGPVDHNMRVGLGYLTYRPRHPHHLSQNDHIVSTVAWVMADAPTRRSWRHARP